MSDNQIKETDSRKEISKKILESKKRWNAVINNLTHRLKNDNIQDIYNVQAESINYRQEVVDEVHIYAIKIHKLVYKMKTLSKSKFEFYATSYPVKTSGSEKLKLIDYDMGEYQQFINELDDFVNFLRDTSKNLEAINYSVKGRVELNNILSGYK